MAVSLESQNKLISGMLYSRAGIHSLTLVRETQIQLISLPWLLSGPPASP